MNHSQRRFGPFAFDAAGRRLLRDGEDVRIGSRALDLLGALLERPGEVVDHDTLVARAWPHSVVEETSLRVQISALRRALGDGSAEARHIATVPGRGYSFVAPLAPDAETTPGATPFALPAARGTVFGRDALLDALLPLADAVRVLTLVGPGGVGKTTLALALARRAAERFPGGVRFVDLGDTAPETAAIGALLDAAAASLAPGRGLLLLDTCEPVVEVLAGAVRERVAHGDLHVIATGREPLDIAGEQVQRVPPLPAGDGTAAAPAVQLFVARATALDDTLDLGPAAWPAIARLCRRLDGLPLAIELAAAQADALALPDLLRYASRPLALLTRGRRDAGPRQQSLQASLQWSHALLSPVERSVLRRLSRLPDPFTLDDASSLFGAGSAFAMPRAAWVAALVRLVAQSWLEAGPPAAHVQYRLLHTTRAFAQARLAEAGEDAGAHTA